MIVYQPSACGRYHGNFISATYRAIAKRPGWRRRLEKVHAQGRRCFPAEDTPWHELDSSLSSDALLMNISCYPRITHRSEVSSLLGIEKGDAPEFGFLPRVPLESGAMERTEIDMKLGNVLFEAKLTEADFQAQRADLVEGYRDFTQVFDRRQLRRKRQTYLSYQLMRNILAAHALGFALCVPLDARRPDLIENLYEVLRAIQWHDLQARCKVLTWQELATGLPRALQNFLDAKYGITSRRALSKVLNRGLESG